MRACHTTGRPRKVPANRTRATSESGCSSTVMPAGVAGSNSCSAIESARSGPRHRAASPGRVVYYPCGASVWPAGRRRVSPLSIPAPRAGQAFPKERPAPAVLFLERTREGEHERSDDRGAPPGEDGEGSEPVRLSPQRRGVRRDTSVNQAPTIWIFAPLRLPRRFFHRLSGQAGGGPSALGSGVVARARCPVPQRGVLREVLRER